jgi:hypothetical protein
MEALYGSGPNETDFDLQLQTVGCLIEICSKSLEINYQIVSLCDMVKAWPRKISRNKGGRDERLFFISAIHENVDCVIYWGRYLCHGFWEYRVTF